MKTKVILLIAIVVNFINVNAQVECADKLSIFNELAKSKNYNDAYPALVELRKICPKFVEDRPLFKDIRLVTAYLKEKEIELL